MNFAFIGVLLVRCSPRRPWVAKSTFEVKPRGSGRRVSQNFVYQLDSAMQRNWYIPDERRKNVNDVYQVGPMMDGLDTSNLLVMGGWGLRQGRMTQYKFSFIGETKNCIIGITHPDYFGEDNSVSGPGLNLWSGALFGSGRMQEDYVYDVGKDSDDVDWFVEYHEDGHVEIYMTLNGEPLGMAFRMSKTVIKSRNFAANMKPLLRCFLRKTMDHNKGIVVIEYSYIEIPTVRPYAAQRKPNGVYFELRNPWAILPKEVIQEFGENKFAEDYVLKMMVVHDLIVIRIKYNTECRVEFHPDGILGPKVKECVWNYFELDEPYTSLSRYLKKFLEHSDRYERLPSGALALYSAELGSLVFTPRVDFDPVVTSPWY